MTDLGIVISGAAGEGIQTIGDVVARCLLAHGYAVFSTQEYESRIRGGHNRYRLRVTDRPRNAPRPDADVLLALNDRAADHDAPLVRDHGWTLRPSGEGERAVPLAYRQIAEEAGSARYANSVAAGALCAAIGLPFGVLEPVVRRTFARHGASVADANVGAARAGLERARARLGDRAAADLPPREARYFRVGAHSTAIPLAAAAAGCRFISAYPMSPSTGIITAFARDPELGVLAEQAEDEIAALQMALGASAAGARSMTATSGGGFALMVEGLSLAGMIETPVVIVVAQRPGPATGLPTRTAQEDLLFAIHAGHGESPRVVLAPSDPQSAADLTVRAFDLADRYQIPVILLTDQLLADAQFSLERFSIPKASLAGRFADPDSIREYRRFARTETGVSPRLYFGQSEHLVCLDSDEHTEDGHITEDLAGVRRPMVEKRLEKGRRLREEIAAPEIDGVEGAEVVVIGWGSTKGAIEEAVDELRGAGRPIGRIHFQELWPLPELDPPGAPCVTAEGNATGQLARLLRAELGWPIDRTIARFDGLPIDPRTIVEGLR